MAIEHSERDLQVPNWLPDLTADWNDSDKDAIASAAALVAITQYDALPSEQKALEDLFRNMLKTRKGRRFPSAVGTPFTETTTMPIVVLERIVRDFDAQRTVQDERFAEERAKAFFGILDRNLLLQRSQSFAPIKQAIIAYLEQTPPRSVPFDDDHIDFDELTEAQEEAYKNLVRTVQQHAAHDDRAIDGLAQFQRTFVAFDRGPRARAAKEWSDDAKEKLNNALKRREAADWNSAPMLYARLMRMSDRAFARSIAQMPEKKALEMKKYIEGLSPNERAAFFTKFDRVDQNKEK